MSTFIVEIDDTEKSLLLSLLKKFNATIKEIKEEKSPYDPKFVEMINKAERSKNRTEVKNVDDLWARL